MSELPAGALSSLQVARTAGVSLRQLQWWDERWVISPRHEAGCRVYTRDQALALCVIAELWRKGIPLQKIRGLLKPIHRAVGKGAEYIVTDGKTIAIETHARLLATVAKMRGPAYVVCVRDWEKRLA